MDNGGRIRVAGAVSALAVALVSSLVIGTPRPLPDIALGSAPLLHVERAAALLAIVGASWVVTWRAIHGELPVRFANVEYESELAIDQEDRITNLHERVVLLEIAARLSATDPHLEDDDESA